MTNVVLLQGEFDPDEAETSRTVASQHEAPEHLRERGLDLWQQITGSTSRALSQRELANLRLACEQADDLSVVDDALVDAEPMVKGSQGQLRPNPLLDQARNMRLSISKLLGELDLDDEGGARLTRAGRALRGARR